MTIDDASRFMASELLQAHWKPSAVAERVRCHPVTAHRWERNIQVYGSLNPHRHGIRGRPRRLTSAAKEALFEYQSRYPWAYQDELACFLEEEWAIQVSRQTIGRLLKENRLSRQQLQRVGPQSAQLRTAWQAMMLDLTAEQLVFLDEALFKMQTGWRCMAYGPIG